MKNENKQDKNDTIFNIFQEGVEFLSALKKNGQALEEGSDQTIYVIEEINELITELLKLQKTVTKLERGKHICIDTIIEETGDVWLTSAVLLNMMSGNIVDILDSANEKVRRTISQELEKGEEHE